MAPWFRCEVDRCKFFNEPRGSAIYGSQICPSNSTVHKEKIDCSRMQVLEPFILFLWHFSVAIIFEYGMSFPEPFFNNSILQMQFCRRFCSSENPRISRDQFINTQQTAQIRSIMQVLNFWNHISKAFLMPLKPASPQAAKGKRLQNVGSGAFYMSLTALFCSNHLWIWYVFSIAVFQ